MKYNDRHCSLIVMALLLILNNSCKEDEEPAVIKDGDGNVYTSVKIGTQVWMVGDLKTTKYLNGDLIGTTTPATLDISTDAAPKYQWAYEGNESNVALYGRLYTWYAVTDSRNVCPTGWHVPTDEEWTTLTTYLGGEDVACGKLKETGTNHWVSPNEGATNETGFTALPSGGRYLDGAFALVGDEGSWWSSSEYLTTDAYYRWVSFQTPVVFRVNGDRHCGFSVRCVKD